MTDKQQPFFSIIIPTFNEESNLFYKTTLESLSTISDLELIIVDKSSQDLTQKWAIDFNAKYIDSIHNSRAGRLNQGIKAATGKIILLHHPRSKIDVNSLNFLRTNYHLISWGGLTHQFDDDHSLLRFTSWYSNNIRGKFKQVLYLDHCIFFRKDLMKLNFPYEKIIPEVDIFEDTLLSHRLQKLGDVTILPHSSITSSIRFKKNGLLRQSLLNQWLKLAFFFNIPLAFMNKIYEKGLFLNSTYDSQDDF